jgi:hypothetical protein
MKGLNAWWLLLVIVFLGELFSPIYHYGFIDFRFPENSNCSLSVSTVDFAFFNFLPFEESNGEEEQKDEGKKIFCYIDFKSVEIFSGLEKFKSLHSFWLIRKEKPNALASLLALHCKLLI